MRACALATDNEGPSLFDHSTEPETALATTTAKSNARFRLICFMAVLPLIIFETENFMASLPTTAEYPLRDPRYVVCAIPYSAATWCECSSEAASGFAVAACFSEGRDAGRNRSRIAWNIT